MLKPLETLVKVKAEALVVENEEALVDKLTHPITRGEGPDTWPR